MQLTDATESQPKAKCIEDEYVQKTCPNGTQEVQIQKITMYSENVGTTQTIQTKNTWFCISKYKIRKL